MAEQVNMRAANEHYKMKKDDSFEHALHLPRDECKVKTSSSKVDEQFFSMVWMSVWSFLLIEILFPSLN